jgi:hypothetical protein
MIPIGFQGKNEKKVLPMFTQGNPLKVGCSQNECPLEAMLRGASFRKDSLLGHYHTILPKTKCDFLAMVGAGNQ